MRQMRLESKREQAQGELYPAAFRKAWHRLDMAVEGIVMIELHKTVRRMPSIHIDNEGHRMSRPINGEVVYIHPKGRFHVVRFDFPFGSFRESFLGVEP